MASLFHTSAQAKYYISLAKSLPKPLLNFLARYPPPQIVEPYTPPTQYQQDVNNETQNPFLPTIHPVTQRRHDPIYSMRRQANLVKQARKYGIEELLPWSSKKTEVRLAKKVAFGSRVKGTGVGQRVKGHKHERELNSKYVVVPLLWTVAALAARRRYTQKRTLWADGMLQDGSKERSHAQHASAHQGMESGTFGFNSHLGELRFGANSLCRSDGRTGRGGPTNGYEDMCTNMYQNTTPQDTCDRARGFSPKQTQAPLKDDLYSPTNDYLRGYSEERRPSIRQRCPTTPYASTIPSLVDVLTYPRNLHTAPSCPIDTQVSLYLYII